MQRLRVSRAAELAKVAEVIDRENFLAKTLKKTWSTNRLDLVGSKLSNSHFTVGDFKKIMEGNLLTYLLHCEARIASFLGKGFYTIGPCGEELLGVMALNSKAQDLTALHYRHLAASIGRQTLFDGRSFEEISLDRARGFAVSTLDPVTGGRHCSIGGDPNREFLVTSTLASQVPPAVGRALSIPLSQRLLDPSAVRFKSDSLSIVSVGDGSLNNAHFLSGLNLARYAANSNIKCPTVFVVSDNNICISLKGTGYTQQFIKNLESSMHVQRADGRDFVDILQASQSVFDYSRRNGRPSLLYLHSLPRRFGHAATDRQFAYYSADEIQSKIDEDPLSDTFSQLVHAGVYTAKELTDLYTYQRQMVEQAFDQATEEPKITERSSLQVSAPLPQTSSPSNQRPIHVHSLAPASSAAGATTKGDVMRKNMTRVFDELMESDSRIVYLGEDVQHGGYYVVTENLFHKYPMRVRDFPPDETTLVGAAMGFAQAGLLPILEIPYAKYLDCAGDMFTEAMIMYWLSRGKQPNGMVIRLQGFDKGIFGGNFHTHNMLHFPPGLDVVCFSNGRDYARGMRYLTRCAANGRVVMSVDSTDLLNRRHLVDSEKDEFFLHPFPALDKNQTIQQEAAEYDFDQVFVYEHSANTRSSDHHNNINESQRPVKRRHVVMVTYGNGVPTSLLAGRQLQKQALTDDYTVIDVPCLSQTPAQLTRHFVERLTPLAEADADVTVIFADVCKKNAGMPMSLRALDLHDAGLLKAMSGWSVIGAENTYNPLGTYLTFLSVDDIVQAVQNVRAAASSPSSSSTR